MSFANHTPGKWIIRSYKCTNGEHEVRIFGVDDHGKETEQVASCLSRSMTPPTPRVLANAVLIASVPQLLAERDRLRAIIGEMLGVCELADACLSNLSKAVDWGSTFDLDIDKLNRSMHALPKVIEKAKGLTS